MASTSEPTDSTISSCPSNESAIASSSTQTSSSDREVKLVLSTPPSDLELRSAIEDQIQHELVLQEAGTGSRWLSLVGWDRFNAEKLVKAEKTLFERVKTKISSRLVSIKLFNSKIYTISTKAEGVPSSKTPYVLLHGYGGGVGIWASNLDDLASHRPVHAIDLLGFGRSSRPTFKPDAVSAEREYVESIEDWRKAMRIDKMVLVGHSFGGYLASAYALEHPSRIRHLILVDPWGYPDKAAIFGATVKMPPWLRSIGANLAFYFNPLTPIRVAGPFGLNVIRRLRPDLGIRYSIASDPNAIYEYIYQINARKPTGELAFKSMTKKFAWAQRPMIHRMEKLDPDVAVTFVYGAQSWIDPESAYKIQAQRPDSYVDVRTIQHAGHHVYADNQEDFHRVMKEVSEIIDNEHDIICYATAREGSMENLAAENDENCNYFYDRN